jgi:hypothetical protein
MPLPSRNRWPACALAASLLLWGPRVRAEGAPVRLELEGAPSCVDRAAFASRLAARGVAAGSGSRPSETEDAVASVRIVTSEGGAEGTLVLRRAAGTTTRVVRASSCDEVVDALAFTLALALEAAPEQPKEEPSHRRDMLREIGHREMLRREERRDARDGAHREDDAAAS